MIEGLAVVGLVVIWLVNFALLYGFGVYGGLNLEDMVANDLGWIGFIRNLVNIFLFCGALFLVICFMLGSLCITIKYFQSEIKIVGVKFNPFDVEAEEK